MQVIMLETYKKERNDYMNKIVFADGTETEVNTVDQSGNILLVTIDSPDLNSVIEKFRDISATAVMRFYSGIDLIRGYAGFTEMQDVKFEPDVVTSIDYSVADQTTESGFAEETVDRCIVTMKKVSMLTSVASQTAQNTANIDYLAMEAGVEL